MDDAPHRRHNPLTDEWVLVSPHRTARPWQGRQETPASPRPRYDPSCYLCPGNERVGGAINPDYDGTYVFTNDFPALLPESAGDRRDDGLYRQEPVSGTCRVLCFSPRHDLTLSAMSQAEVRRVVDLWADQVTDLEDRYRWVQIFENRGEMMGASNPHPHGQVWASDSLPTLPAREAETQRRWFAEHGRPLLTDYAERESSEGRRVVVAGEFWMAVVPYWAVWPFETMLLPKAPVSSLPQLGHAERDDLAGVLRRLLAGYDRVFDVPFPYSMGWHGAPSGGSDGWVLHAHVYPPLLRSATVRKFLVGYEMLAEPQRDLTAEQAAERLRSLVDAG